MPGPYRITPYGLEECCITRAGVRLTGRLVTAVAHKPKSPCQVCGALIIQDGGDGACAFCGKPLYPLRWRREARGGYGYVELVPCRLLDRGRARVTIAALRADKTEAVRSIKPENLVDPPSSSGASG